MTMLMLEACGKRGRVNRPLSLYALLSHIEFEEFFICILFGWWGVRFQEQDEALLILTKGR